MKGKLCDEYAHVRTSMVNLRRSVRWSVTIEMIINMLMLVQQISFTRVSVLLVLTDGGNLAQFI